MEREKGRHAFSAISLSVSLFVLWRCDVLTEGRRRDGQSQRSAVKSRLWLMNSRELPSHWDEFILSHNHSLLPPTSVSIRHPHIYLLLSLSFCSSVFLSFVICCIMVYYSCSNLFICTCPASCLCSVSVLLLPTPLCPACCESLHLCSFWDKSKNPEPWNKLDPTYQYKVTIIPSQTRTTSPLTPIRPARQVI